MICIVGAGLAGDTAAAALRAEGYPGRILLIGDEPERPYDRPPLSKEALFDDAPDAGVYLRAETWYEKQRIELRLGTAVASIEPSAHRVVLADGEAVVYEKLLIATGSRARSLPAPDGSPVSVVRTMADARRLREALQPGKRVVIVGAGVIGLEVAASASKRGCSVDVVDLADRVLSRIVPPPVSAFMADVHRARGVRLHLSAGSVAITPTGIRTEAAGEFSADIVVVGIGVAPNVELAEAAGLACRDGILVDEQARTSDPDIFAVGDAARYPDPFGVGDRRCENWKHAQAHAVIAAKAILGSAERYAAASSMWSDQFDIKLQTVGVLEGEAIARGAFGGAKFLTIYRDPQGVVVGALGVNSAKDMRFAQMLIEKRVAMDAGRLADPGQDLRKLMA